MNKVRRLLSAEPQVQITPSADTDSPKPPIEDSQLQQELLLETPFGQSAFRPPFTFTDREVELLRLVAREDEITAEQIRVQTGRKRAVDDLNELLDRLYEEVGLEPVVKDNDVYRFDPNFPQNTDSD